MKILVTGGNGFTGSALVLKLLAEGHQVRSLDYKKGIRYEELKEAGAEIMLGSITDKEFVERSLDGVEIVFHLAAAFRELNVPDSFYYDVNVNGTRHVMETAVRHNVRKVIYCSTQGVHGNVANPPGDENVSIAPEDYYQQTKYEGELVVKEYQEKGINFTIIRPTAIYGPGDPGRFLMLYKWVMKGYFPMFGNGKTYYHPVYIDNLVDAFLLCMEDEAGSDQTYIIADEEYLSIEELVGKIGEAMDKQVNIIHLPITPLIVAGHICQGICKPFKITPPIFPRRVDWYRQTRAFKIDKAKAELNYEPRVGIFEGLKQTGEWYLENGYIH